MFVVPYQSSSQSEKVVDSIALNIPLKDNEHKKVLEKLHTNMAMCACEVFFEKWKYWKQATVKFSIVGKC